MVAPCKSTPNRLPTPEMATLAVPALSVEFRTPTPVAQLPPAPVNALPSYLTPATAPPSTMSPRVAPLPVTMEVLFRKM